MGILRFLIKVISPKFMYFIRNIKFKLWSYLGHIKVTQRANTSSVQGKTPVLSRVSKPLLENPFMCHKQWSMAILIPFIFQITL